MAPLQGLTGLYPDPQDTSDYFDEGVLEARAYPGTPDAEHGQYGSQHLGYSGTIPSESPFSPMSVYDGWQDNPDFAGFGYRVAGEEYDKTPTTHSSPYPRGIIQQSWDQPDALAVAGIQMAEVHSEGFGGAQFYNQNSPTGRQEETDYTTDDYVAPNDSNLAKVTQGQLKPGYGWNSGGGNSGGSNADPDQGYGVVNTLEEFNAGHSIRRVQHDSMHFDYTNTHGEQNVPFMGRHPVEQMPLDGPDSPYFEQGDIDGANIPWEGRIGYPTPYEQPAEPTIVPAPSDYGSDVFAWTS